MTPVPRLQLSGITKQYPAVRANDDVSLTVMPGQIHAVLGENGAGKSTMMKMIYGAVQPDAGQILIVPKAEKGVKLADLKGKKVGAQIGTTGAMEIKKVKDVELKTYDEVGLAFEDMAAGRIGGVVCDEPTAIIYALQKDEYKSKFKIVGKPFTKEAYGIVVKKGNKELVELLNKGIDAVKKKKLDAKIRKQWLK